MALFETALMLRCTAIFSTRCYVLTDNDMLQSEIKKVLRTEQFVYYSFSRWLERNGVKREMILTLLQSRGSSDSARNGYSDANEYAVSVDDPLFYHKDDKYWYFENYGRREAEKKLANKPNGSFLIRPGTSSPYALSIV